MIGARLSGPLDVEFLEEVLRDGKTLMPLAASRAAGFMASLIEIVP
ncbi:MAG TPA: hypothetical protein VFD47_09735 [Actinomycetota bacterium]|nr:hypothetical protein [Actinomycetota bacterium]